MGRLERPQLAARKSSGWMPYVVNEKVTCPRLAQSLKEIASASKDIQLGTVTKSPSNEN